MGEQSALGDRADAPVAIAEGLQDPGVTSPGFEPEMLLQCRERDHTFDRAVRVHETEHHAAAIGEHMGFDFNEFHGKFRINAVGRGKWILAHAMRFA